MTTIAGLEEVSRRTRRRSTRAGLRARVGVSLRCARKGHAFVPYLALGEEFACRRCGKRKASE
jgi:hypothetical protein